MIAGWFFPDRERCGIAIYSRNYISALKKHCIIKSVNSDHWLENKEKLSNELNSCDLIHIQYETSFFLKRNRDFYTTLLRTLKKPLIVSLHEVYAQFPGVFPRDQIRGGCIESSIKKLLYDFRHPYQTAYYKHLSSGFGASVLLVHHQFQKEILEKRIPQNRRVIVSPMPVLSREDSTFANRSHENYLSLGTTGFINPEFDYSLLFETLEKLTCEWKFVWVGGIRIPEHQVLLDTINLEISTRNWKEKFITTGWVSDETQDTLLDNIDIYLALFKNRSSSASLARAIGAHRIIIATECQIVMEINNSIKNGVISMVKADSDLIAEKIESLSSDKNTLLEQRQAIDTYSAMFDFGSSASAMMNLYKTIAP